MMNCSLSTDGRAEGLYAENAHGAKSSARWVLMRHLFLLIALLNDLAAVGNLEGVWACLHAAATPAAEMAERAAGSAAAARIPAEDNHIYFSSFTVMTRHPLPFI